MTVPSSPSPLPGGPSSNEEDSTGTAGDAVATTSAERADRPDTVADSVDDAVETPKRRRRWRWLAVPVGVVGALGLAYAADVAASWDDVPRNTTVEGVAVGGMSLNDATALLENSAVERETSDVPVRVGESTYAVAASPAGLTLDAEATLDPVSDTMWNPIDRITSFWEPTELRAVVTAGDGLDARLQEIAEEIGTTRVDAGVRFDGVTPVPIYPKDGLVLDVEAARDAVLASWFTGGVVSLPLKGDPAVGTRQMVDTAIASVAAPAVAGPITVTAASKSTEVQPSQITQALRFSLSEEGLKPTLDPKALETATGNAIAALSSTPKNAQVRLIAGVPTVLPSTNGWSVPPQRFADAVSSVLTAPVPRAVVVPVQEKKPEVTTEIAKSWGINQVVGSFTTYYSAGQPRVTNIHTIARIVDGYVVKPGERFSLNTAVGPRDTARGFVEAPMIYNGEFRESVGGGISQFATTLYNAVFFAGLKDVAHSPHSYYISRYPPGREATVSWPAPALIFENDSPYGVIIDTSYTSTSVTVKIWSTKRYDIEAIVGPKRNFTSAPTKYLTGEDCHAASSNAGFTITNTRVFKQNGAVVKTEDFTWTYKPQPKMVCR